MTGTVLDFDGQRGYGWLIGRDLKTYFVHVTQIEAGPLTIGDPVIFQAAIAARGRRAFAVRRLPAPAAARAEKP